MLQVEHFNFFSNEEPTKNYKQIVRVFCEQFDDKNIKILQTKNRIQDI